MSGVESTVHLLMGLAVLLDYHRETIVGLGYIALAVCDLLVGSDR